MLLQYLRSLRAHRGHRESLPYVDPLRAGRHPFQIFLLSLCVVSAAPYMFGAATAEAVAKQLPIYLAFAWGISLFLGSTIALVGSLWRGSFDTALTMERSGLYITGVAAVVYGLCILGVRDAVSPFFALMAFAGAACVRMPVSERISNEENRHQVEDILAMAGVVLLVGGLLLLGGTSASTILVSVAIITGFGLSCLQRARDIARIFVRAKEINSVPVLTEHEEPEPEEER